MNTSQGALARAGLIFMTATVLLCGCNRDPNLPTEEMKRAQNAIEQAEKAGAQRYAMADLRQAKEAYKLADDAHHQGNPDASRVHAMEATTLAARAATLASSGETQRSDAQAQRSAGIVKDAHDAGAADVGTANTGSDSDAGSNGPSDGTPTQQ